MTPRIFSKLQSVLERVARLNMLKFVNKMIIKKQDVLVCP